MTITNSVGDEGTVWAEDEEYVGYQWWLARSAADGDWEIVSIGY